MGGILQHSARCRLRVRGSSSAPVSQTWRRDECVVEGKTDQRYGRIWSYRSLPGAHESGYRRQQQQRYIPDLLDSFKLSFITTPRWPFFIRRSNSEASLKLLHLPPGRNSSETATVFNSVLLLAFRNNCLLLN